MTSLQAGTRTHRAVVILLLVMAAVLVAQSFGRFTWNFVLPSARDGLLGGSNTWAGLLGTLNLAAYLAGALAVARRPRGSRSPHLRGPGSCWRRPGSGSLRSPARRSCWPSRSW